MTHSVCQIPTYPHLSPYRGGGGGVGRNIDRCIIPISCVFSIGAQISVCIDSCSVGQYIGSVCVEQFDQIGVQNGTSIGPFEYFLKNFNCTNSQSYLIPGIPVDTEECLSLHDFS